MLKIIIGFFGVIILVNFFYLIGWSVSKWVKIGKNSPIEFVGRGFAISFIVTILFVIFYGIGSLFLKYS